MTTMTPATLTETTLTEGGLYRLLAWLSPSFPIGAFSYSHGIEAAVEAGRVRDRESLEAWVAAILRHGTGRLDADLFRDAWDAVSGLLVESAPSPQRGEGRGEGELVQARISMALLGAGCGSPSPCLSPEGRGEDRLGSLMLISARADAHRGTAETALEARAQGEAFLTTCRAAWPHPVLDAWAAALADHGRPPAYAVAVGVAAACAAVPLEAALTAYLHAVAANLISAGLRLIPLGQTDGQRALCALEPVVADCVAAALARPAADFGGCALAAELASIDHEGQYTRLFRS